MPMAGKEVYDAVVIGAGIGGLVCGCHLAKAGMKVLIVEQHDKPGGYCTSFKRRGFTFDAAAHSFGSFRNGGHVRKILTGLGLDEIINIRRHDPSDIIISPDFKLTFRNDVEATISGLSKVFPEEKRNIRDYYRFLTSADQSEFIKLKDKTFESFLHSFFKDEKLISALALPVLGNGGLPPSLMHAFSGSKIFSEFIIDGGYYPGGSIQDLPDAMVRILKRHNGHIMLKRRAGKILQKNNAVTGIRLDGNETVNSRYVVSACDITQTLKVLLGGEVPDKKIMDRIRNMTPSLSIFILYLGIDGPFRGLPEPGTNTWYLPHYDLDEIYNQILRCDFDKAGMYMLRVSPNQKTLLAFMNAPFRTRQFWEKNKKRTAEAFLDRMEKLIPGLKPHITYLDAATPHTLQRYTSNYKGAAYGWAPLPSQVFDPAFRQKSSIKGLYLTGHWVTQAHGIPGVVYLGYNTAKLILKNGRRSNSLGDKKSYSEALN